MISDPVPESPKLLAPDGACCAADRQVLRAPPDKTDCVYMRRARDGRSRSGCLQSRRWQRGLIRARPDGRVALSARGRALRRKVPARPTRYPPPATR